VTETRPPEKKAEARGLRVAIVAGAGLLLVGLWLVTLVPGWLSRDPSVAAPATPADASSGRRIQATLFYVSDDGSDLIPVARDVPYGATPADQARQILTAQVHAAPDGYVSAIPGGTTIRSVFLGPKGELYVDLSPDGLLGHVSGSLDEALAVFAIVNAVTVNLPDVNAVQILVDGKEVDSLAGHIDLREPLGRADGWIRKGQ
jgi:spore germination protein GerM